MASWFRGLDLGGYWLFPFPHFNFRWSWVDWQKLKSSPRVGWALEYGNYLFTLHYLKTGSEFRPVRFLWFSAEVCAILGGVEEPMINEPNFTGQAGLIIPLSRRVRLEAEVDYFRFGKDEHLTRLMAGDSLTL